MSNFKPKRIFLVVGILLVLLFGILWFANPQQVAHSGLSGLIALQEVSQKSVPYDRAIASDKPAVIEFYANWCTTCQEMAIGLKELHQQYGEEVNFVMLDIDRPEWTEQLKQYQVTGVPQITLLNSEHRVVKTLVGMIPETVLDRIFYRLITS